jgi:hypothetical protein
MTTKNPIGFILTKLQSNRAPGSEDLPLLISHGQS